MKYITTEIDSDSDLPGATKPFSPGLRNCIRLYGMAASQCDSRTCKGRTRSTETLGSTAVLPVH